MIKTNKELSQAVNTAIDESGYKKSWVAEQMGISRQGFSNLLNKQTFSLDDANKILELIGREAVTTVNKKDEKKYIEIVDK